MKKPASHRATPASDYVLIRREVGEKESDGGIVIPDMDEDSKVPSTPELQRGTVLAVGPGYFPERSMTRVPMEVKPGDRILFSPLFRGLEQRRRYLNVLGKDELYLRERDIWAIVEEEES